MDDQESLMYEADLLRGRMQSYADQTVMLTGDELRIEAAKQELEERHERAYQRLQVVERLLGLGLADEDDLA